MHNPVKVPSMRRAAPTSGALAPLRARHTISPAVPSLNAMATPDALVKAWARWAITANSSADAPRALLLAVLFAVSEACVAIVRRPENQILVLQNPDLPEKILAVPEACENSRSTRETM